MRPTDMEPAQGELEVLLDDEERRLLANADVPEEVKSEIAMRLERFEEEELDAERAEGTGTI